jgi:hypothetical protein
MIDPLTDTIDVTNSSIKSLINQMTTIKCELIANLALPRVLDELDLNM